MKKNDAEQFLNILSFIVEKEKIKMNVWICLRKSGRIQNANKSGYLLVE